MIVVAARKGLTSCAAILLVHAVLMIGCDDRYQEGYEEGYAFAYQLAKQAARADCEQQLSVREDASASPGWRSRSTEVCGGGGVNVNGKHVSAGPTGCVRVFSDGTWQQY